MKIYDVELIYENQKVLMNDFPIQTESSDKEWSDFGTFGVQNKIQKEKIAKAFSELGFELAYIKAFPSYQYFLDNTAGGLLDLHRSRLKKQGFMRTTEEFDFNVIGIEKANYAKV